MRELRFSAFWPAGACLLLGPAFSCTPSDQRYERSAAARPPSARHAIHTEWLQAIMSKLGTEAGKRWPQEIAAERAADARREQTIRFSQAAQLSAALAHAADQIPQAITGVELTDTEREAFLAHVNRLRSGARELESSAARRNFDRMHKALHSIRTTCNSCHAQFRELTGPVELPHSAL